MRRLLLTFVVLLAACGGGGGGDGDGDAQSDAASSPSASSGVVGETTTTAPGDLAASASTLPGEPPAPPDSGDDGGAPNPSPSPAPGQPGPAPVAPGTYRYSQSGWFKSDLTPVQNAPAEGTLVVDVPAADGTQVWHRYIDPAAAPSDVVLRFDATGQWLVTTIQRAAGMEIACQFNPPVAAPPWPPAVGATISGHGACGNTSADVSGSITGTKQVQVGADTVEVFVVETIIVTSGQIVSQTNQVDWYAPSVRLMVHSQTDTQGKFGSVGFESHGIDDLVSLAPS